MPISEKSTPTRPSATKYQRVTLSLVRVAAHADSHGHRLGIFEGAAAELHPHVGVRAVLAPVEQVGLHRALFTGERVEAPRFDAAVEDEREQDLEGLGLDRIRWVPAEPVDRRRTRTLGLR